MPGMSASVSSSIFVMENPSPTFSSFTVAPVWMRFGVMPARESCAVSAIVKQPAWAAPINSSGLVADCPASNRDLKEYGPSKAPLPTFNLPLPSARLPFHSASAFLIGIKSPFNFASSDLNLFPQNSSIKRLPRLRRLVKGPRRSSIARSVNALSPLRAPQSWSLKPARLSEPPHFHKARGGWPFCHKRDARHPGAHLSGL